jgi:O-acetylserine/cysteine efflux transporter
MPVRSILLALAVTALWGFSFVVISHALQAFPPLLLAALRCAAAALPVLILVRPSRLPLPLFAALSLTLAVLQHLTMFVGIDLGVPPGLASLLLQSQVFFTTALAFFVLKERPGARQYAGIAIAAGGMVVIAASLPAGGSLFGFVVVLCSAAAWGVTNLLFKLIRQEIDLLRLVAWCHVPALVVNVAVAYGLEGGPLLLAPLAAAGVTHYLAVAFLGLFSTGLGYLLWSTLMRRHSATLIAPFSLLIPIFGMTFMATLMGESFGPLRVVGAGLVMVGRALCVVRLGGRPAERPRRGALTTGGAFPMVRRAEGTVRPTSRP